MKIILAAAAAQLALGTVSPSRAGQLRANPGGPEPALQRDPTGAAAACIALCERLRGSIVNGHPWESGQCLTNSLDEQGGRGWACDVASCPRTEGDSERRNRCDPRPDSWVEVDHNCELLRFYESSFISHHDNAELDVNPDRDVLRDDAGSLFGIGCTPDGGARYFSRQPRPIAEDLDARLEPTN